VRLHEITARSGIKVFIFGDAEKPDVRTLGSRVTVHRLDSKPGGDIMAVRPDGHVGFRSGIAEPARLVAWLDLVGARA
jgi:predicted Ser/Thr protein kinase